MVPFDDVSGHWRRTAVIFKAGCVVLWCNGKPAKTLYLHRFCAHLPKHDTTVNQFCKLDNCAWNMARLRAEHMKDFAGVVNLRVRYPQGRDERAH